VKHDQRFYGVGSFRLNFRLMDYCLC